MTVTAGRHVTCQACSTQLRFYAWADTTRTTITCRRCHDLTCAAPADDPYQQEAAT
jgi:hypothetical protein